MQLIKQSHEILSYDDPYKLIEAAGRTCYKSEDKITNDSSIKFIKNIINRKHFSVLEHDRIAFKIDDATIYQIKQISCFSEHLSPTGVIDPRVLVIDDTYITVSQLQLNIASANLRAWKEFLSIPNILFHPGIEKIAVYFGEHYPELFPEIQTKALPAARLEAEDMRDDERLLHTVKTVRFITNRGVTHELVRHRPCAFSQESTRYVKYGDDMEFILPVWMSDKHLGRYNMDSYLPEPHENEEIFIEKCVIDQEYYSIFLERKWKPEKAREVLSNALKTEIVTTCTLLEWKHIFSLRTAKAAHPQIRDLMTSLLEEMKIEDPALFGNS